MHSGRIGHDMKKYGRYRFWAFIVLTLVIVYAVCNGVISDSGTVFAGYSVRVMGMEVMPLYGYVSSMDSEDTGAASKIADNINPINGYARDRYIKRSELSGQLTEQETESRNTDFSQSLATQESAESAADMTTAASVEATTVPEKTSVSDIAAAASANIITGTLYPKTSLSNYNYVLSNFYTVTGITELGSDKLRPAEFLQKDMKMSQDSSKPQILIFHTHSQEAFADSAEGDEADTIVGVGDYLTRLLSEKYGYNVIHDRSVYDLVNGKLDRSKAYTYAEQSVASILEKNPSIEVVIDLHRDGVPDTTRLVTEVNGKKTAKIMFFNGLSYSRVNGDISYLPNPYRDDNLALSLQMQLMGNAYYPGYLRRIYVNAYRYCLHMRGKSMLIEAGAQTNTVEEVKNAMEPLADILDKTLRGEKCW